MLHKNHLNDWPTSKTWPRTGDMDPKKPGHRKTWTLKNLDPKKHGINIG